MEKIKAVAASPGVGLGRVVVYVEPDLNFGGLVYSGREKEIARLELAVTAFKEQITLLAAETEAKAGKQQAAILTGQIAMISDPFMITQMEELIGQGRTAEAAVSEVTTSFKEMFANVEDEKMRQRATDIGDLRKRLLMILMEVKELDLASIGPDSVVVGEDLPASVITSLPTANIQALVSEIGGYTSHGAIMARALGLPLVSGVTGLMKLITTGDHEIIVDGTKGEAIVDPDENAKTEYRLRREAWREEQSSLKVFLGRQTVDGDGVRRTLSSNISSFAEAKLAQGAGADGIGLFRTEFLFLDRETLPGEEEQFRVYSEVASLFPNSEVVIRTLDVGGDKEVPALDLPKEDNPFLGYRAIRFCLDHTEIFSSQLRAILRAGAEHGNIKIMLPLVTSLEEITSARALMKQCLDDLKRENLPCDPAIQLGIMVETPAAVLLADILAKEADFFSIGTNDLTQYILAADRGNSKLGHLNSPFHPAVLRAIENIIKTGRKRSIPVSLCGEAGADPMMIPLLMAYGLDKFSVSPSSLASVRREISTWRLTEANSLANEVRDFPTTGSVKAHLLQVIENRRKLRTIA
ncbi:MAG: phosphoenolpyruvate--protein phosphotransferase [Deltaproteobacteria bacterium]|jgi:phosphotransferase system enzyme I (PtsI)|nr:phosphoenolpyruvate--protein phosphotransferase [Deltaproteobacteria bacterium]